MQSFCLKLHCLIIPNCVAIHCQVYFVSFARISLHQSASVQILSIFFSVFTPVSLRLHSTQHQCHASHWGKLLQNQCNSGPIEFDEAYPWTPFLLFKAFTMSFIMFSWISFRCINVMSLDKTLYIYSLIGLNLVPHRISCHFMQNFASFCIESHQSW